jgi:hypothetical protein
MQFILLIFNYLTIFSIIDIFPKSDEDPFSSGFCTKKEWGNRPFKTPFFIDIQNEGVIL